MSSSKRPNSTINLRSVSGPVEMHLLDHRFQTVAVGYGKLRKRVPAGIYRLDISAGAVQKREYISLQPGDVYEDLNIELPFPAAGPVEGTSTSHEFHGYPAGDLSRNPNQVFGSGGRLLLFFRNIGDQLDSPINLAPFSLLDHHLDPLCSLAANAVISQGDGWAALSADVSPGGYILRNDLNQRSSWSQQASIEEPLDQSIWVCEGWTTILFIPNWSNRSSPSPARASVYMARTDSGYYYDDAAPVNLALELALDGLIYGQPIVSPDLIDLLLEEKFQNPMLGIIGAHSLLAEPNTRWSLFDIVVRNLRRIIPDHPDVIALHVIGKDLRDNQARSRVAPVDWPPMLYTSYRGLIRRDASEPGLIIAHSVADQAASRVMQEGPWTRWRSIDQAPTAQVDDELMQTIRDFQPRVDEQYAPVEKGVKGPQPLASPILGSKEPSGSLNDPEVIRVAQYVQQVSQSSYSKEVKEENRQIDLGELSKKVGLPVSSVRRALRIIAEQDLNQI